MRRFVQTRKAPVLCFLFCCSLSSAPAADDVMTAKHVARTCSVGSAVVSPDGLHVAYTRWVPRQLFDEPSGSAWSELHVASVVDGKSRPFITGEVNVGAIHWTPSGDGISFLAKRGDDEHKSLYVIPVDGGESRRVLTADANITSYS